MAWDEHNFDDRQSNLRVSWERREKAGRPRSDAKKVWDQLSLELEFSGKPLVELETIAWFALKWMETKNPHYIDAAFIGCRRAEIEPPPTLMRLMEEVAALRFDGRERSGTGKRIRDDRIRSEALRIVCGLHLAGLPVDLAASKAARYIVDQGWGKSFKASTLERDYSAAFRSGNPTLEDELREVQEMASDENRQAWARLAAELPEATEDLKGNRRD